MMATVPEMYLMAQDSMLVDVWPVCRPCRGLGEIPNTSGELDRSCCESTIEESCHRPATNVNLHQCHTAHVDSDVVSVSGAAHKP